MTEQGLGTTALSGQQWGALFSERPAVAVAEARVLAEMPDSFTLPPLPAAELEQIAHAVPRRQLEFATARLCARRAAAQLGAEPFVLLNGADRAPLWPPGLVGSLTHTARVSGGYCAAAVALAETMRTIGIDAEQAEPLPLRLWHLVLTPDEQARLRALDPDPDRQGLLAKVVFSAKECFYKAQFPLTHRYLGFRQVEVSLELARGAFQVRLSASAPSDLALITAIGRFLVDEELVRTAIAIPR